MVIGDTAKAALMAIVSASLLACSPSLGEPMSEAGCQLYRTDGVSEETARQALDFMVAEGFCLGEGRRVQLGMHAGTLELRIQTRAEVRSDPAYLAIAQAFAAQLSGKALAGRAIDVALCDEALKVLTRVEGHRWGVHVTLESCGLYVSQGVTPEEGERFLALINEDLGCQTPRDFRLVRHQDAFNLYLVLDAKALGSERTFHQARLSAGRAARVLFNDASMAVHLADVYYASQRSALAVDLGPMVTRGACTVFQGEGVEPGALTRFMGFIDLAGYCGREDKVYRLSKQADGWHVAVVVQEAIPPAYQRAFKTAFGLVAAMMRGGIFEHEATYIDLCDPVFESCTSIVGPDLGKSFILGGCSIFYDPDIEDQTMSRVRAWLGKERFCEGSEQLLRLRRDGEGWAFSLAVRAELAGSKELETLGERISRQLSSEVFGDASVRFVPTNEALMPLSGP